MGKRYFDTANFSPDPRGISGRRPKISLKNEGASSAAINDVSGADSLRKVKSSAIRRKVVGTKPRIEAKEVAPPAPLSPEQELDLMWRALDNAAYQGGYKIRTDDRPMLRQELRKLQLDGYTAVDLSLSEYLNLIKEVTVARKVDTLVARLPEQDRVDQEFVAMFKAMAESADGVVDDVNGLIAGAHANVSAVRAEEERGRLWKEQQDREYFDSLRRGDDSGVVYSGQRIGSRRAAGQAAERKLYDTAKRDKEIIMRHYDEAQEDIKRQEERMSKITKIAVQIKKWLGMNPEHWSDWDKEAIWSQLEEFSELDPDSKDRVNQMLDVLAVPEDQMRAEDRLSYLRELADGLTRYIPRTWKNPDPEFVGADIREHQIRTQIDEGGIGVQTYRPGPESEVARLERLRNIRRRRARRFAQAERDQESFDTQ